jgi:hypothetical protein
MAKSILPGSAPDESAPDNLPELMAKAAALRAESERQVQRIAEIQAEFDRALAELQRSNKSAATRR